MTKRPELAHFLKKLSSLDCLAKRYPFRLLASPWAQIVLTLPFVLALGYKAATEKSGALPHFQEAQALNWHVIQQFSGAEAGVPP